MDIIFLMIVSILLVKYEIRLYSVFENRKLGLQGINRGKKGI